MPVKPMLGDLELELVQEIEADEQQVRAQHAVPALEGDFLQPLGRRAAQITLSGVLAGEEVAERLKELREKFRLAEPVPFVADIATATRVGDVLIEEMGVRELAGKPERFEYAFTLREFIPPPEPKEEPPPPPPPPPPEPEVGELIVEVIVEGRPSFDFSTVTVTVDGQQESGASLSRTLTRRENNIWTEADFPPGSYTAKAVVTLPEPMAGSETAVVRGGEKTKVTITLRPGSTKGVATAFVIHYWFDKAFIEPCLRPVLREAVAHAASHPDQKLLIVGHTDLVGDDSYNQALSERRARGVYAFLTFQNKPDQAVAEWNELRKGRTVGQTVSLKDTWGTREYQYILQDLGFYVGPINEKHDDNTDAAVRAYQRSKGLAEDGIVGDDTWPLLVRDYLAQDSLSMDDGRFFPNAGNNCSGGPVFWLGCGEKDPVDNRDVALRQNRRTELLFVADDAIPCQVPRPVTWDIRPDGSAVPPWCLGPGKSSEPCCFLTRGEPQSEKWQVVPAHPEKVSVSGTITFEDGTPFANGRYALIAPDGKYLQTNASGAPVDGEHPSGPNRGRPIFMRTDADGNFSHPEPTPVGTYIIELPDVEAPNAARLEEEPPGNARGNVVCKEFTAVATPGDQTKEGAKPGKKAGVKVGKGGAAGPKIKPEIVLANPFVLVKKSYTVPGRVEVTLKSGSPFSGTGTFTCDPPDVIQFFKVPLGGSAIVFDGRDNSFDAAALTSPAGVKIFAQGAKASSKMLDVTLKLTLVPAPPPAIGPPPPPVDKPATAKMTSVALTIDLFHSRKKAGKDPDPFPQPPDPAPAPGTATDKWFGTRFVHIQNGARHRAMLVVKKQPAAFEGDLVLRNVKVSGTVVTGADTKVELFNVETGGASSGASVEFKAKDVPAAGRRFFAEGKTVSGGLRDTGFQLGIKGFADDGDRVALTVYSVTQIVAHLRSTPCLRDGSHAEDMADHNSTTDTRDFTIASRTVLRDCGELRFTATAAPAAVAISWDIQRASDDHASLKGTPNRGPGINNREQRVIADNTGSFHIFAFVDSNGTGKRLVEDDGLTFNLNMVQVEIQTGAANNRIISSSANYNDGRASAANLVVDSGTAGGVPATNSLYTDASFAGHAIAMKVTIRLTGGGANRRRGEDKIRLGYIHVMDADNFRGTYADGRSIREVFTVDPAAPSPIVGPDPITGLPFPLLAFPVRDHRTLDRRGSGTFINSSSDADRTDLPGGMQRRIVRFIDSPAIVVPMVHPITASALASISGTNDFIAFLVGFSSDYDENFTAYARAAWTARFGTFAAGPGWTNAAATTTAGASMTVIKPPARGENTGRLERCPPGATDNLKMDAT